MKVKDYLEKVAYKTTWKEDWMDEPSEIYLSKFDDSYITHVGLEDAVKFLAEHEITEELTHGVGFSPKENKWYGWSHRAIYGFTIGSTCKKGDLHYRGSTMEELEEDAIRFWKDEYHKNVRCEGTTEKDGNKYFIIKWEYTDDVPNKSLRGTTLTQYVYIGDFGRGEWVAKTMDDAKQMAIDFCEGVS
jgi:hypothetical protein